MDSFWNTKMECNMSPFIQPDNKPAGSIQGPGQLKRVLRRGMSLCFSSVKWVPYTEFTYDSHAFLLPSPHFLYLVHFWKINV